MPDTLLEMPWLPPFADWAQKERAAAEEACALLKGHEDALRKVALYERQKVEIEELQGLTDKPGAASK